MLASGTRLGPYAIVAPLGAGGMGEVYRALDAKLNREVAIKILPEVFSADPERAARFEREAQILAALNHQHIAAIYGLEESGATMFLVLELVDGQSLDARLKASRLRSPDIAAGLPVDEALTIARQIIDALEAAHEKGIVHRDLKPANIMLTADGQVKVLDFGLAKQEAGGASGAGAPGGLTHSPTLTFAATQPGMILGTASYMAPEQAKGRAADKRCDVWAFGCVLFEMLTGTRAFDGEDATDVIAAVVRGEPDWAALPGDTPSNVRTILTRCLEKDRKARIPDIAVVRFLMDETSTLAKPANPDSRLPIPESRLPIPVARWRTALPWTIAAAATVVAGLLVFTRHAPAARPIVRLYATPPAQAPTVDPFATDVAISPDGRRIAYTAGASQPQLYVRELSRIDAEPIAGIVNVRGPFFSPDGEWIGYFQGPDLKKVPIQGGPPMTICANCSPGNRGASWGSDDTIVFSAGGGNQGLQRVPAAGGASVSITTVDRGKRQQGHVYPEFIQGKQTLVYTILMSGQIEDSLVVSRDLTSGTEKVLVRGGTHGHVVGGEYLVYGATGTLRAVRFDADRLTVSGNPVPVLQRVITKATGAADFSVSGDGTLVYVQGDVQTPNVSLVWRDRQGHDEPIPAPPRGYTHPRVSPDGRRVALDVRDQENDIWIWDLGKQTLSRFTFDAGADENAVWTPDGKRIAFSSVRGGPPSIYWQTADGTGAAERLSAGPNPQFPWTFTPDGRSLVIRDSDVKTGIDLALVALDGSHAITPLLHPTGNQVNADLSPDGKWIAYQSNESGRDEVYVRPFPAVDSGRWQMSTTGGTRPVWARNGHELFYLDRTSRLVAVPVQPGSTFASGNPVVLFDLPSTPTATARTYDVAPDGRFLVLKFQNDTSANTPTLNVVLNWSDELQRLAPPKR